MKHQSVRVNATELKHPMARKRSWLSAILMQACPRCREGRLSAGRNRMHQECPVCGLRLIREQGWFLVAMYFSYLIGIPALLALALLLWYLVLPGWDLHWVVLVAMLPFVVVTPLIVRYSRVLAIHLDYFLDRGHDGEARR